MADRGTVGVWIAQVRGKFLVLAVVLVLLGLALAALDSGRPPARGIGGTRRPFDPVDAALLLLGVVCAHASVNLFNEYSDSQTGIDDRTQRTPFSGGTGLIQSGATTPGAVRAAAWLTLSAAFCIGLYFAVRRHWVIGPIMVVGGLSTVLYTRCLARLLLGEFFAGLCLGSLVVIGTYIGMTARPGDSPAILFPGNVVLLSIPPGILTALLLFLNEFPDLEADRSGGRFHLVIWLGRRRASYLYAAGLAAVYLSIGLAPALGYSSGWPLLGLATLPIAARAARTVLRHHSDQERLVPALGANVAVVLGTDLLLAAGVAMEKLGR